MHVLPTAGNPAAAQNSYDAAGGEVKEEGRKKAKQEAKQEGARGEQGKEEKIAPLSQPEVKSGEQRYGTALQPAGRKVFCAFLDPFE